MLSSVPFRLVAGTTLEIRRTVSGYSPLDGWTYKLYLAGPTVPEVFEGVPDVADFLITITATETAALLAGAYRFSERVEHTDGRVVEIGVGTILIIADLATAKPGDQRTHARRTLEAIEAVIEKRATSDQESYQINGRTLVHIPIKELLIFRDKYREEVRIEELAGQIGGDDPRKIGIRFRHA